MIWAFHSHLLGRVTEKTDHPIEEPGDCGEPNDLKLDFPEQHHQTKDEHAQDDAHEHEHAGDCAHAMLGALVKVAGGTLFS